MLDYSEASYGKQVLVGLIDALLTLALVILVGIFIKLEVLYAYLDITHGFLPAFIVFIMYRLLSLLFFRQTLGMRLFRLILLNGDEQPLTFFEKTLAAAFILYRGTGYYQIK